MKDKPLFQDTAYLKNEQYKNSTNLDARATLHRRFRTAVTPWQQWVFDHLALQPGTAVLECGCGPGRLWRDNLERLPPGCQVTLTDLSAGMVAEATAALQNAGHSFYFQAADVQKLPFPDDSFDVVIANHMLYHVPDLTQGLREVRRVLRADGRFLAATNGQNHLQELWQIGLELWPGAVTPWQQLLSAEWTFPFQLEDGKEWLTVVFDHITRKQYEDSLAVTEAEPILDYLLSSSFALNNRPSPETITQVRQKVAQQIAQHGAFHITKDTGLFMAW